jgi:hypothetical protein
MEIQIKPKETVMIEQTEQIGAEVYWNDPDNGNCSGWKVIRKFVSEDVVLLTDEEGAAITEAYVDELS